MQNPKMNSISSAPKIGWLIEFFPKEIKSGFKKKSSTRNIVVGMV